MWLCVSLQVGRQKWCCNRTPRPKNTPYRRSRHLYVEARLRRWVVCSRVLSISRSLFAADTPAVSQEGHISRFLGITESIYLYIATPDGMSPNLTRLFMGPCVAIETAVLRM